MRGSGFLWLIRLLPVVFGTAAATAYAFYVQGADGYAFRNAVPILTVLVLAAVALVRGNGRWSGRGLSWPLATIGFAIPALGLSLYLHYGYATDMHGMYSEAIHPREMFRFLPYYTMVAGGIGFAIGWIIGKNA